MRMIALATIVIAMVLAAPVAAEEMLANPTFAPNDEGAAPETWRFQNFKTNGQPLYVADGGQDDSPAAGITAPTDDDRGCWVQNAEMGETRTLMLTGVYRTEGMTGNASNMLRLTWLRQVKGWDYISDTWAKLSPADDWTEFSAVFIAPEEANAVAVELFNFFRQGTIWYDQAHLREATREEVIAMAAEALDRKPNAGEVNYEPAEGEVTATNPPPFVWLPVKGHAKYTVQYAPEGDFDGGQCVTVEDIEMTVHTPHEMMKPGRWAWRYGFAAGADLVMSRAREFTIPEDAQAFPLPRIDEIMARIPDTHPRVYFSADGLDELRANVRDDVEYAAQARGTISSAERKIGEDLYPEPEFLPKSGQERGKAYQQSFRTMRPFTGGMETCAKAYILTGDERFGQEARRRLLHFMTWDPEGATSVRNNDEAAMDIAKRAPRVYDWIYDLLSDEERQLCREALGRRMKQINEMHRRMPFDSRPYSSHPGRMIGFVIEGSIVFAGEIPEAKEWLDYTLKLMWSVYPAWGCPDGGWAEGSSYWMYYTGMLLPAVMLLDDLGVPYTDLPYLQNTGWMGLYEVPAGGKMRPFGDGHEAAVSGGHGTLLYRLSTLYDNPYWRWYAEQFGAGPGSGAGEFYSYDPTLAATAPTDIPQARAFPSVGIVGMHSDLSHPDRNVYLLMRSSPYGSVSHSHASQNAIAIQAYGQPLAISSGYYQRYGSPHHAGWTWETRAHNSVLVDGEGQVTRSPASQGRITVFDDTDEYCYTVGDATEAYGGRLKKFLRRVLFLRPNCFVICDELESASESSYQWLLHSWEEMDLDEAARTVTISRENARLTTTLLSPPALSFAQVEGFDIAPERPDSATQYHFTADTGSKSSEATFLSVLSAWEADRPERAPDAELLEADGGSAVRLIWEDGSAVVLWRLGDATEVSTGEISTDAEVAVVRMDGEGNIISTYAFGGERLTVEGIDRRGD